MKESKTPTETQTHVVPPSGGSPSASSAPSVVSPVPESPEVSAASAANRTRAHYDILNEAADKLGIGVTNSAEAVAHWCRQRNLDQAREHYQLLLKRLREAHALLAHEIENLPTL